MSAPASSANTLSVTDLRLASCYRGLGFRYLCRPVIHNTTGKLRTEFLFELHSLRFTSLNLQDLHEQWKNGALRVRDPMHVLCVMMAGQANYDAFLSMTKDGIAYSLRSVANGCMTRYFEGADGRFPAFSLEREETDDMRLAASAGLLGIPCVQITEPERGKHVFHLARTGYPVMLSDGTLHLHDARDLLRRDPTPQDPLRLHLEVTQPLHPLCIAYDALFNRTELKRELSKPSLLLIDAPGQRITTDGSSRELLAVKQALVDINAQGHVMDHVTAHMQSPPISWDKQ